MNVASLLFWLHLLRWSCCITTLLSAPYPLWLCTFRANFIKVWSIFMLIQFFSSLNLVTELVGMLAWRWTEDSFQVWTCEQHTLHVVCPACDGSCIQTVFPCLSKLRWLKFGDTMGHIQLVKVVKSPKLIGLLCTFIFNEKQNHLMCGHSVVVTSHLVFWVLRYSQH